MARKVKKQEEAPVIIEEHVNLHVKEPKYPASLLVKSEALRRFGLHYDILCAILGTQDYTLSDAKSAVQKYIDSFEK